LSLDTPHGREIKTACILISVAHIAYCFAIFFLNFAYFFYLPAFAGIVISLVAATKREAGMVGTPPIPPPTIGIKTNMARSPVRQNRRSPVVPNRFGIV
jgi:hypothetical protein